MMMEVSPCGISACAKLQSTGSTIDCKPTLKQCLGEALEDKAA